MRILYVDIDSLRRDHLGCYGYHRNTSPNIDQIAHDSVRFENIYISDAPCLPSRTALFSGRTGFHTGVVDHAGTAGQPFVEGPSRRVRDKFRQTGWIQGFRNLGMKTATVSSFGDRHAAWHWYAGFSEIYDPGKGGMDRADEVAPIALDWLQRNGRSENWFLHVNFWDPHTPYRTPEAFGNPFEQEPIADWLTEDVRQRLWEGYGPHSAQEPNDYVDKAPAGFPRVPAQLNNMDKVRQWIDGYDVGVRYADDYIGRLFNTMADLNILDDTIIMISADHGENLGELNIWGDHQTADEFTCNVPLIVKYPGMDARVDSGLHYHFDWGATLLELAGGSVPDNWDGESFADAFKAGEEATRPYLVTSQGAWSCQRGVRFANDNQDYLYLKTYHDGLKMLEPDMLFNLTDDPHEQKNLTSSEPETLHLATKYLADWYAGMMQTSNYDIDPLMTVIREGGPSYTRGRLPAYLERLRKSGRSHHAEKLARLHPTEI